MPVARPDQASHEAPHLAPAPGDYPALRFMGSKHRLLPWIHDVLAELPFHTALDAFSGSGCVSYLLKTMGKRVHANDFLRFAGDLATATTANSGRRIDRDELAHLTDPHAPHDTFIADTFRGIFFSEQDNAFLDVVSARLRDLDPDAQAVVKAALYRSCLKAQPRGVFTFAGRRYDDGRRDLRIGLHRHFTESIDVFNRLVFDNGHAHTVTVGDVFDLRADPPDLVYLDPPYVPRADDNCYIKRYHFLEGLATYWRGVEFHPTSKVRKLAKRYTPFSYRRTALDAFDGLFARFAESTIVLSYSSNGYPDIDTLRTLLTRRGRRVELVERPHRYHFGTHAGVAAERARVTEYLLVAE